MSLYDDASLIMFPSGYKEDKIYSLKPTDGSGDLTFTRASTATRVNADGLIEKVRTNLFLQSEAFNVTWGKSAGITLTGGQTDPFGGTDAFLVNLGTSVGNSISQSLSLVAGEYTMSAYIKGVDLTGLRMIVAGNSSALVTSQIVNGTWVRVVLTGTLGSTGFVSNQIARSDNALNQSFYIYGAQLEVSASVTEYIPTTTAAVSVGMLANVPRIDYTGGGCGKLLLEPQRTNLVTYSEDYTNAAWTKSGVTITANNTTSPDGTTNADKIVATADNSSHYIEEGATIASGATNTFSVFAKKGEYNYLYMNAYANVSLRTWFNLDTGEVGFNTAGNTASIEDYGNGWYRCIVTNTSIGTTGILQFGPAITNGTINATPTFLGDGTSGVYTYGASLEAGNYVSSYVKTLASSVTRLADAAFKTGISSLIGQTEGTFFLELSSLTNDVTNEQIALSDGTDSNTIKFVFGSAVGGVKAEGKVGGVGQFGITQSTSDYISNKKIAIGYKENDFVFYYNGVQVGVDTAGTVPTMSAFNFSTGASSFLWNGKVNQAILFPTRLTNDQLADLTGGNITTFNALATLYGYQII